MEPFFITTESTAFEGVLAKLEGRREEEECGWGVGDVTLCRWYVYGGMHLALWERKENSKAEREQ